MVVTLRRIEFTLLGRRLAAAGAATSILDASLSGATAADVAFTRGAAGAVGGAAGGQASVHLRAASRLLGGAAADVAVVDNSARAASLTLGANVNQPVGIVNAAREILGVLRDASAGALRLGDHAARLPGLAAQALIILAPAAAVEEAGAVGFSEQLVAADDHEAPQSLTAVARVGPGHFIALVGEERHDLGANLVERIQVTELGADNLGLVSKNPEGRVKSCLGGDLVAALYRTLEDHVRGALNDGVEGAVVVRPSAVLRSWDGREGRELDLSMDEVVEMLRVVDGVVLGVHERRSGNYDE